MTAAFVRELEELLAIPQHVPDRRPPPRYAASPAYGPMTERVTELLDRARSLTPQEIERLAATAGRVCRGPQYAEALLAMRHAAEISGRTRLSGLAGMQAEQLVIRIADERAPAYEVDDARWTVVGQQAGWAAGDAARALVVGDLLPEGQLQALTSAWATLAGA